jgi:hypothetical protein
VPSRHEVKIAANASRKSAIRSTGLSHGMEKRFVMCERTWVPSPSTNLPFVDRARSHAA